jgi:MoxR-like ATPase
MTETTPPQHPSIEDVARQAEALRAAVGAAVVGQTEPIDEILCALLAGGHVLLEGVPGVAKTLLARSLATALGLAFNRIQFTPDLMPSDITGTSVFDFQARAFQLQRGPVFTQVLLADEINRTPPKTQAALLEAMAEGQVTIDGVSHRLDAPFFVIATQNPLEHEGTYPLPEAQLDRFLAKVLVGYPEPADELAIYRRFTGGQIELAPTARAVERVEGVDVSALREVVRTIHVEENVLDYVRRLVAATRTSTHLAFGASPRAGLALIAVARARAALDGRGFVLPDDVKALAPPVLRHRLLPTAEAELEGQTAEAVLQGLLDTLEVPR